MTAAVVDVAAAVDVAVVVAQGGVAVVVKAVVQLSQEEGRAWKAQV